VVSLTGSILKSQIADVIFLSLEHQFRMRISVPISSPMEQRVIWIAPSLGDGSMRLCFNEAARAFLGVPSSILQCMLNATPYVSIPRLWPGEPI
jgi:hypothetical protein